MSNSYWDDFEGSKKEERHNKSQADIAGRDDSKHDDKVSCDWGFRSGIDNRDDATEPSAENSNLSKFIELYECYLEDKHSIKKNTKNQSTYANNPQKTLQEWFDNEGHEFSIKIEQPRANQYVCSIDIPVEDQDFTITSECHNKKQEATDEVCLAACMMLDECQLLYAWQLGASSSKEDLDRKRRFDEANKEDDIELDQTSTKRLCDSQKISSKVNTYESLLAKWNELNFSILKLKAELVKLDLSVVKQAEKPTKKSNSPTKDTCEDGGDDDEDEIDPLDEYMSSLETKTKLSVDEKIKKSRIKTQIASYEREQAEVSRLIELAKPKFDLNKACPPAKTALGSK